MAPGFLSFSYMTQLDTEVDNHRASRNVSAALARPGLSAYEACQDTAAMRPPEVPVSLTWPTLPGHLTTCTLGEAVRNEQMSCGAKCLVSASTQQCPKCQCPSSLLLVFSCSLATQILLSMPKVLEIRRWRAPKMT